MPSSKQAAGPRGTTFPDAGLLIRAASPKRTPEHEHALRVLLDPARRWCVTSFLRLEVLSRPKHLQLHTVVATLEAFFGAKAVRPVRTPLSRIVARAEALAVRYGLTAMDALHVASALEAKCSEFITAEKDTKRDAKGRGSEIHRVTELRVTHVDDVVVA